VASAVAAVPYLWALWDLWNGSIDPLRRNGADTNPIYDVQARAIMHGHLWIPRGSIGAEAFVSDGRQYTYFGIFPSLLRIPIFLFTHALDGRLFGLSTLAAWIMTGLSCALLLWRLRVVLRGDGPLGWAEAASYGVILTSVLAGSVLVYLASRPDVFNEDEAWSVALACASLFALLGVLERPSWRRITFCGTVVLLTNLNRSTTGYPAILAMGMLALWFGLGRAGDGRRRWAMPVALAALPALVSGCAIDLAKFHMLFGIPFSDQLVYQIAGLKNVYGGRYISPHWLPDTLAAYVDPLRFQVISVFPWITPVGTPHDIFAGDGTVAIPFSMPLLFTAGCWGVVAAFWPGRSRGYRGVRILLVAAAMSAGAMLIYGWIFERFLADFMPLLVLAAMIGLVDLWGRMGDVWRRGRVAVVLVTGALALFGFWANMGYAVIPQGYWNRTQTHHYVEFARALSDLTGHPLDSKVVVGNRFPGPVPVGTLFVKGRCAVLYLAFGNVPLPNFPFAFLPVENAPHTPLCHAFLDAHTRGSEG